MAEEKELTTKDKEEIKEELKTPAWTGFQGVRLYPIILPAPLAASMVAEMNASRQQYPDVVYKILFSWARKAGYLKSPSKCNHAHKTSLSPKTKKAYCLVCGTRLRMKKGEWTVDREWG